LILHFYVFSTIFYECYKNRPHQHYLRFKLQRGLWKESKIHTYTLFPDKQVPEHKNFTSMPLAAAASSPTVMWGPLWRTNEPGLQFTSPRLDSWWWIALGGRRRRRAAVLGGGGRCGWNFRRERGKAEKRVSARARRSPRGGTGGVGRHQERV
jgi:hypothetical protein